MARKLSGAGRVAQGIAVSAAWPLADFLSGDFRRSAGRPGAAWGVGFDSLTRPDPAVEIETLNKFPIVDYQVPAFQNGSIRHTQLHQARMPDPGSAEGWCQRLIWACSVLSDVHKFIGPFAPCRVDFHRIPVSGWKSGIPRPEGQMLSILRRIGVADRFSRAGGD